MLKQGGLHLSQLSKDETRLSFEKDEFAATAQFKMINTDSPADGAFCQLGSGKTFVGGDTDENERHETILGDEQTSCFCGDKSGFSVVLAIQGAVQKRDESSEEAGRQDSLSSFQQQRNKDWILNSGGILEESSQPVYDATAYESNG